MKTSVHLEHAVQVGEHGEFARAPRPQPLRRARAHAALVRVRHRRTAAEPVPLYTRIF